MYAVISNNNVHMLDKLHDCNVYIKVYTKVATGYTFEICLPHSNCD